MSSQWDKYSEDAELIQACLKGDEKAWTALIHRYRRLIYTVPFRFGLSNVESEEIFQEVCLILLEKMTEIRNQARLSAWLVTVTKRTCIRHIQLTNKNPPDIFDYENYLADSDSNIDEILHRLERRHTLQQGLEQLDPRCRTLLEELFLTNTRPSYEELAQTLGISIGSIGPTRSRCLNKLREIIEQLSER